MRKLTSKEQELWEKTTRDIKPLVDSPVSPVEQPKIVLGTVPNTRIEQPSLDLHGLTIHNAYLISKQHIENAFGKYRFVTIITGLSGSIKEEFPRWFESHPYVRSIKPLNGGGAWEIWLKKQGT